MLPEIRRVIVADAHHRRSGRYPSLLHSLGTGEAFTIAQSGDGFVDLETGLRAHSAGFSLHTSNAAAPIELQPGDDVSMTGYDPASRQRFTVRASGGVSVTLLTGPAGQYFQYAVTEAP